MKRLDTHQVEKISDSEALVKKEKSYVQRYFGKRG
jgi:hypothetical protein